MDPLHLVLLALVQGITEFLPISSSGHLIMIPLLTDWPDQGVLIDVAVHMGTLGAVVIYLYRDLTTLAGSFFQPRNPSINSGHQRALAWKIGLATVPVIVAGFVLHEVAEVEFRSLLIIAWAMIGFGVVLWLADRLVPAQRDLDTLSYRDALLIGLAQVLALIPGTSRAGITMTAARMIGFRRTDAAKFSMLLSIPTILAAGALATLEIVQIGDLALGRDALIAAFLSLISALIAIFLMMRWLRTASFTPFVIYRIALGVALLVIVHFSS